MNYIKIVKLSVYLVLILVLSACNTKNMKEEVVEEKIAVEIMADVVEEKVPFIDIPNDYEFVDIIADLYEGDVIKGFEDNTFRPDVLMTES